MMSILYLLGLLVFIFGSAFALLIVTVIIVDVVIRLVLEQS